jgi:uncharacterized damage-inducible protein DinB
MKLSEMFLPEFDQEMANTRKMLERFPEGKPEWRPHEKSMTLSRLAGHVAELPGLATVTIERDRLELGPASGLQPTFAQTREQVLEVFDKNVKTARAAIAGANDEHLLKPWTLILRGQTMFTMPRTGVLRSLVMNHLIHHRAQLGVYYRLNNVPLPALYGPSADEGAPVSGAKA